MIEARVTCGCSAITIPDLNLQLRLNDIVWISESAARLSPELQNAIRVRAVSVTYQERCLVSRPPLPNHLRQQPARYVDRKQPHQSAASLLESEMSPTITVGNDTLDIRSLIQSELRSAIRAELANHKPVLDEQMLKRVLAAALQDVTIPMAVNGTGVVVRNTSVSSDDPLFIPSQIVQTGTTSTLTAESTSVSGDHLDSAANALKAARKGRGKVSPTVLTEDSS